MRTQPWGSSLFKFMVKIAVYALVLVAQNLILQSTILGLPEHRGWNTEHLLIVHDLDLPHIKTHLLIFMVLCNQWHKVSWLILLSLRQRASWGLLKPAAVYCFVEWSSWVGSDSSDLLCTYIKIKSRAIKFHFSCNKLSQFSAKCAGKISEQQEIAAIFQFHVQSTTARWKMSNDNCENI